VRVKLSPSKRAKVMAKTGHRCAYCGCQSMRMQVDHIKPICDGGTDDLDNLLPACGSCNNYKLNMSVESMRRMIAQIPLCPNGYKLAVGTGVVIETGKAPVFHFETLASTAPDTYSPHGQGK
jgi:5-methylcytosine-specific restriction endonuclease McrA